MTRLIGCICCAEIGKIQVKRFNLYRRKNNGKRKWVPKLIICENLKHIQIGNQTYKLVKMD